MARRVMSREHTVAPAGFARWRAVPGSFLVQLSIGSVYSWSIFNGALTRQLGVVAEAAGDWSLGEVVPIFSSCAITLALCTALLGPWAERAGPRKVAATAAVAWGSGLVLTGVGCATHTLPLLYVGYGVLGGLGWGLGYISPVSSLMKWFPDRRGLATGLALSAFGGGAIVATPLNELLMSAFFMLPEYLGPADALRLVTEGGRRYAEGAGGALTEVVLASAHDLHKFAGVVPGVREGAYAVGTGSTGAASAFFCLAGLHTTAMLVGAFSQRVPAEGWAPAGWTPPPPAAASTAVGAISASADNVDPARALRTPQFYLFWAAVAGNAVAGVSVISCAKTIMSDIFGEALPGVVDGAFAAGYVAALSAANMAGRFGWAYASDAVGRKRTYYIFSLGAPLCISIPLITGAVAAADAPPTLLPLVLFYGATATIVSFYGGLFSVLPACVCAGRGAGGWSCVSCVERASTLTRTIAFVHCTVVHAPHARSRARRYLADVFGMKHVGAIHGRVLTAWSAAALTGPTLLSHLRGRSYSDAAHGLAARVDDGVFLTAFGAPRSQLEALLDAKTVTIAKLMDVVPPGTLDPTPTLYNTTMYSMAGVLAVAALCNAAMRPVHARHHIVAPPAARDAPPAAAAAMGKCIPVSAAAAGPALAVTPPAARRADSE